MGVARRAESTVYFSSGSASQFLSQSVQLTHLLLLNHTADWSEPCLVLRDSCLTSVTLLCCPDTVLFSNGYGDGHMPGPAPDERACALNDSGNSECYALLLPGQSLCPCHMSVFSVFTLLFTGLPVPRQRESVSGATSRGSPHLPSCSI